MTQILRSKHCPFQMFNAYYCVTCMCTFCNQSHSLWPSCWLLTQPQRLPWTWYNLDCLISLRIIPTHVFYKHLAKWLSCSVVFHCIITFLGMQLQLLNMWSILHCHGSINSILLYLCLGMHALACSCIFCVSMCEAVCLSLWFLRGHYKHWQMHSTGTVWQLMPVVLDFWIKACSLLILWHDLLASNAVVAHSRLSKDKSDQNRSPCDLTLGSIQQVQLLTAELWIKQPILTTESSH